MSDARATSLGAEAENYEAARPDYPFEAVAWMLERLPEGARRLADVGAGTGKLTWVRRFTEIMHASAAEQMLDAGGPTVAHPFGELVPGTAGLNPRSLRAASRR